MEWKEYQALDEFEKAEINTNTIERLAETNEEKYNWEKLAEELFELGEVVMKKITKKPGSDQVPPMSKFVEEAGDVIMRIAILAEKYTLDADIQDRVDGKLLKYHDYLEEGKYLGGI